jgi:hypothetical protein
MRIASSVVLVTLCAGCVTVQRDNFARERAGEYIYQRPLSEVWPHVVALLVAQGYSTLPATQPDQLETEWKEEATCEGCAVTYSRYQAMGKEDRGRCIVRFVKAVRTGGIREGTTQTAKEAKTDQDVRETQTARKAHQGSRTDDAGPDDGPVDLHSVRTNSYKGEKLSGTRDLGMEWLLLQRVEPKAAAAIYQAAEAAYR